MTRSRSEEDVPLPPGASTVKHKKESAGKRSLLLKLWIAGLLGAIFVIFISVLWEKYLEPHFGFDLTSGEQSTAEAISLAPVVNDIPPSIFQGQTVLPPLAAPAIPEGINASMMSNLLKAIQDQVEARSAPQDLTPIYQTLGLLKAVQVMVAVERGQLSIPELKNYLVTHPQVNASQLRILLSQMTFEVMLSFPDLYREAKKISEATSSVLPSPRLLDRIQEWAKSLVKVEKGEEIAAFHIREEFLMFLKAGNLQSSLEMYPQLSPVCQDQMKLIYDQLLLRQALEDFSGQLTRALITEGQS